MRRKATISCRYRRISGVIVAASPLSRSRSISWGLSVQRLSFNRETYPASYLTVRVGLSMFQYRRGDVRARGTGFVRGMPFFQLLQIGESVFGLVKVAHEDLIVLCRQLGFDARVRQNYQMIVQVQVFGGRCNKRQDHKGRRCHVNGSPAVYPPSPNELVGSFSQRNLKSAKKDVPRVFESAHRHAQS